MSDFEGFAELRSPKDLFTKLKHDQQRMISDPQDVYAAFDFFVTAEHLVDWRFSDSSSNNNRKRREDLRNRYAALQTVSHIANGAKHFRATAKHHKSVEDVESNSGGFSPTAFSPRAFSPSAFRFAGLTVKLNDGSERHVLDIAEEVIAIWDAELYGKSQVEA